MNIYSQIFVVLIVIIFNLYIIWILRKEMLDYQYALTWMAAGLVMLLFSLFPNLLADLATFLGIGVPLNLTFFLGILFAFLLIFRVIISYSKMKKKLYQVVQQLAILENEVKNNKEKPDEVDKTFLNNKQNPGDNHGSAL